MTDYKRVNSLKKAFNKMNLKRKVLILVSISILASMILSIITNSFMTKRSFESSTRERLSLSSRLVQLNFDQFLQDVIAGFSNLSDDVELTRDLLSSLNTVEPRRNNFYKMFYFLNDFANQNSIEQISVHFTSRGSEGKYRLFGAALPKDSHVFSFSTKPGTEGAGLIELYRDSYGFFSMKEDGLSEYKFKFPLEIRGKEAMLSLFFLNGEVFVDINFPIVNKFFGGKEQVDAEGYEKKPEAGRTVNDSEAFVTERKTSGEQEGFSQLGYKFGVVRAFLRIPPAFVDRLERETGVSIDLYSLAGEHLVGRHAVPSEEAKNLIVQKELYSMKIGGSHYINYVDDFKLRGKKSGYLVMSVLESLLTRQLMYSVIVLLATITIFSVASIFVTGEFLKRALIFPLLDIIKVVKLISEGDRKHMIKISADDELGLLATSVNKMQADLNMAFETIEEHSHNLEKLVEERTGQLYVKTNDINAMLQNIKQGIFTITENLEIHHEYSVFLETILDTKDIAGKPFVDVLFSDSSISEDLKSQIFACVAAIVGENRFSWMLNNETLPRSYEKRFDGYGKLLEIDWNPIIKKGDVVDKLLVTVRDVTEIRKLRKESESRGRELEILGEILSISRDDFDLFIASSQGFLEENRQLILKNREKDPIIIETLFRNMHTIKGNARIYGLKSITTAVHRAEQTYDELRFLGQEGWNAERLIDELKLVEELIEKYSSVNEAKLGSLKGQHDGVVLDRRLFSKAMNIMRNIDYKEQDQIHLQSALETVMDIFESAGAYTIEETLGGILKAVPSLAQELNKAVPIVNVEGKSHRITQDEQNLLKNIFMHTIRNSIYHGIESIEERKLAGKPFSGLINIKIDIVNDFIECSQRDDGRGLNIPAIRKKAVELNIISENENMNPGDIANLIFVSGISTAREGSLISGRGVGMDAVRKFIEQKGGKIELILSQSKRQDFIPFEIRFRIPKSSKQAMFIEAA
ncbi:MAG: Hpt domain-containing protein [Oligoflexales bacterium]|nr:Hpt domain-containing protein [Oligoflexales bacterium]